jgi:hypothetical protein
LMSSEYGPVCSTSNKSSCRHTVGYEAPRATRPASGLATLSRPPPHAGAQSPGPWWMRMPNQAPRGRRVVTSWTIHVLPSGSLKEKNDP